MKRRKERVNNFALHVELKINTLIKNLNII